MAKVKSAKKNPVGRPRTKKGPRAEVVKVSLHKDELATIMKVTDAPASFLREAGLEKARNTKS